MPSMYSDFDMSFKPHPITGDLVMLRDDRAVMQSIRHLMGLMEGDLLMEPGVFAGLRDLLFQTPNGVLLHSIKKRVTEVITQHEPRIELKNVDVFLDEVNTSVLIIRITFYFANHPDPYVRDIPLQRTR